MHSLRCQKEAADHPHGTDEGDYMDCSAALHQQKDLLHFQYRHFHREYEKMGLLNCPCAVGSPVTSATTKTSPVN